MWAIWFLKIFSVSVLLLIFLVWVSIEQNVLSQKAHAYIAYSIINNQCLVEMYSLLEGSPYLYIFAQKLLAGVKVDDVNH